MTRRRPDDPVASNRRAWDATVRRHDLHRGDEAARLRRGDDPPEFRALGGLLLRELGDLNGKDVLHLLCNHGAETVALARRARSALGVDLSGAAVASARRLARAAASPATFVRAEAVSFLRRTPRRFDVVTASWGVTCWLPDLHAFARGVARVLRPGGFFHLLDGHPMANSGVGVGDPGDRYFGDPDGSPRRERWAFDYVGARRPLRVPIAWWQWTLGDVVTSLAGAGLRIEHLHEFEGTLPAYYGTAVALDVSGDAGSLPGKRGVVPMAFSVKARRPSRGTADAPDARETR